jgi:hypothetical protein
MRRGSSSGRADQTSSITSPQTPTNSPLARTIALGPHLSARLHSASHSREFDCMES